MWRTSAIPRGRRSATVSPCDSHTHLQTHTTPPQQLDHVVSTDGTPIAVWRSGEGPPLVLVHGTTADHTRWAPGAPGPRAAVHRPGDRPSRPRPQRRRRRLRDRARVRGRRRRHRMGRRARSASSGTPTAASARSRPRCSPNAIAQAGALRGADRLRADPAAGRRSAPGAARSRRARRAAGDVPARGGRPPGEQIELMRSLPAWAGAARRRPHDPARGAREPRIRLRRRPLRRARRCRR